MIDLRTQANQILLKEAIEWFDEVVKLRRDTMPVGYTVIEAEHWNFLKECLRRTEATLTGRVVQVGGIDHTPILQEPQK